MTADRKYTAAQKAAAIAAAEAEGYAICNRWQLHPPRF